MPFDEFSQWCQGLERRLDPAARMSHFLSLELGQNVVADDFQIEAITSRAPMVAMRVCRQAGKSCVLATRAVMELERGGTVIAVAQAERFAKELARKVAIYLRGTDMVTERSTLTEIEVNTVPITRGDIVDTVGATGTLQAVTTVDVPSAGTGAHHH